MDSAFGPTPVAGPWALDRRGLIKEALVMGLASGAAATSALAAAPRDATEVDPRRLDLTKPADNVYAIVKIQGDVSGRPTIAWGYGHIFGVKDGAMARPLMQYRSCRIGVFLRQPDQSFRFRYRGLITYHDYATGKVIDRFLNPYTGREVAVKHWKSSIGEYDYTLLGLKPAQAFKGNSGETYGKPYILPWQRAGNTIWTMLDERVEYLRPSDGEWRRDNAIMRFESRWDQLSDPRRSSASASSSFQTHIDWFSWLGMTDVSGGLMQGGMGRKFDDIGGLPREFVAMVAERFPGFLTDAFQ